MGKYTPPSFDIISYEIEDIITLSIGNSDPNGGDGSDWWAKYDRKQLKHITKAPIIFGAKKFIFLLSQKVKLFRFIYVKGGYKYMY